MYVRSEPVTGTVGIEVPEANAKEFVKEKTGAVASVCAFAATARQSSHREEEIILKILPSMGAQE